MYTNTSKNSLISVNTLIRDFLVCALLVLPYLFIPTPV